MQSSMHKNIHTGQAGIMRTVTIYTLTGTSTYLAAAFTLKKKKKYLLDIFGLFGVQCEIRSRKGRVINVRDNTHRERQD